MKHILDLPYEILTTILIMLASSYGGAGDIARLSSTCAKFMSLASEPHVLKVVNFRSLTPTEDYEPHHNLNGLLCQCAQAGNLAAEAILGKGLLKRDIWLSKIIYDTDQPPLNGVLRHEKLVRSFIRYANNEEIAKMRAPLLCYVYTFAGEERPRSCGIIWAINCMCSDEILGLRVFSNVSYPGENTRNNVSFRSLKNHLAEMTPPPVLTDRDLVLRLYDRLFSSGPV